MRAAGSGGSRVSGSRAGLGAVGGHTTGATIAGGDAVGASRSGGAVGVSAKVHIEASGAKGTENGLVVGDLDVRFHSRGLGVEVGLVAVVLGVLRRVVALDSDLADGGEVVAVVLDVLAVPVDHTTGPVDGALGVGGLSGGPERHLQTGGGLGELVLLGGLVVGVGLLQGALDGAVDNPVDLLGGPVDFVGVPVVVSILTLYGDVAAVVPCDS